jgi:dsDNA-binding SOS-regulon protein
MMTPETQKYLKEQKINPIYHKVYSISDDLGVGDSTLSFEELKFEDLTLFFQNLEEKTENILKQKLKLAFEKCAKENEEPTLERIRNFVLEDIRTDSLVYSMQKPAIASALNAIELDIFNQANKTRITTSMLCQPGKISVINVNGLDIPRRRLVAVALLQLLHRYKEKEENAYPGVILVMDEAEQLFPIKCSGSEKAHVDRIITKTKEIADNGRKRHFGQFICTHLAESIDSRVVGLAETIMAFRCSGDDKWIRSTFGKNYVDEINNLKTGEAEVFIRISEQTQKQIKAKIYFPDVSLQSNHNI